MTNMHPRHQNRRSASRGTFLHLFAVPCVFATLAVSGCKSKTSNPADEAPEKSTVIETSGGNSVSVKEPGRFPLAQATTESVASSLQVTGSVNPDVSREIPVLSLANGRVVALHVGLGDTVHKGQLVMEVQSPDVTAGFGTYLKAVNDEHLANVTLTRDKLLYDKGAIPKSQLDAAQAGEDDAHTDLTAAEQQLKIYGVDKNHPGDSVKVYAPATGVIIAQNVASSGAAGITYGGNSGSFTIADLSHVWVIVDVYENDLKSVHLGQHVDITLNAYPGKTFSGTISDIGAQLDPSLRTAKVRIQVPNPSGELRLGMFATGTIASSKAQPTTAVPATAILQLHDRSYVFVPTTTSGTFRRVEIKTGRTLEDNKVVVTSGISTGQQVIANALSLQNTADQE